MLDVHQPIPVLDKGFVRLVDHYGSDQRIVDSARVSYQGGTKSVNDDPGLIDYLMRHEHMTPFEMADTLWHVKVPIFVARQWHRHRTASINEISARYSVIKNEFYIPTAERIKTQSKLNKQGSDNSGHIFQAEGLIDTMTIASEHAFGVYNWFLEKFNMARELARIVLPQSTYTEFYWKTNVRNLMNFLRLRGPEDGHAQAEIQAYTEAMRTIFAELFPYTNEAFEEHVLYGLRLSKTEISAMAHSGVDVDRIKYDAQTHGMRASKLIEFETKLERFRG